MGSNYSPDLPITNESEDKFQRFNFSKRIADTIINRKSKDCIVIGIYGSWGEGKTSVLNFIENRLQSDPKHVVMKFNPWRYQDEQTLLMQFFRNLATSIDGNLKNKKEKVGEFLTKYASLISFSVPVVGNLSNGIKAAGEILDLGDLEELKKRTNELIETSGRRITVMIDDIDRLDKAEIHTIFRIVKLSADFSNTSYVLSFDEKMVAAAIGDRFAGGGTVAGQNFLEKIIQVPLRLPMVRPELIQSFCIEQIEHHLADNEIQLQQYDRERYISVFEKSILPRLNTPRISTRYSNSLSFSIPLLNGEVNIVDLMIIEALKIFYPEYYNVVRYNPDLFLDTRLELEGGESTLELISKKLYEVNSSTTDEEAAKYLIKSIFPAAQSKEHNHTSPDVYYKHQSIAAPHYFERYFTYAVIDGDLSDLEVKNFVFNLGHSADNHLRLENLVSTYSANLLLKKFSVISPLCDDLTKKQLGILIAENSDILLNDNASMSMVSDETLTIELLDDLLMSIENQNREEAAINIVEAARDMYFVMTVLGKWSDSLGRSFIIQELDSGFFNSLAINRAIELSAGSSIFKAFPRYAAKLAEYWVVADWEAFTDYIQTIFQKDKTAFISIFDSFIKHEVNDDGELLYSRNFSKALYNYLISIIDVELIINQISMMFSKKQLSKKAKWIKTSEIQIIDNLVLQFMELHSGLSQDHISNN